MKIHNPEKKVIIMREKNHYQEIKSHDYEK